MDKDAFLSGISNWCNHRFLLWLALEETKGAVLELGMGEGSTRQLLQYCDATGRDLVSCDCHLEWIGKFAPRPEDPMINGLIEGWFAKSLNNGAAWKILYAKDNNWATLPIDTSWPCVLVDHAPGERRWEDILRLKDQARIMVIHDSEPAATGYMLNKVWPFFKYRVDCTLHSKEGAWASAVSNSFDVRRWVGQTYGDYVIREHVR